jgi:hypothetical protein
LIEIIMLSTPRLSAITAALMLGLVGCVTAPAGPRVAVYPGTGKSFDQFRADDMVCRQYASDQIGGVNAAQAANDSAVASGIVGTLIGAAAGGAIGGRQGAAVGAGTGLLIGSASGANAAQSSGYGTQRRYDISYQQCMYAKGNSVPGAASRRPAYPPPGYTSAPPQYVPTTPPNAPPGYANAPPQYMPPPPPPPNAPPPGQN